MKVFSLNEVGAFLGKLLFVTTLFFGDISIAGDILNTVENLSNLTYNIFIKNCKSNFLTLKERQLLLLKNHLVV